MQDYVVDASIVVQHFVADTSTVYVDKLFDKLGSQVAIYVPEICLVECTNVLWKRVRFHGLPLAQAEQLITDLIALPMTLLPSNNTLVDALRIGISESLAIYDSVYIVLAEKLSFPLITADTRQAVAASKHGVITKLVEDIV